MRKQRININNVTLLLYIYFYILICNVYIARVLPAEKESYTKLIKRWEKGAIKKKLHFEISSLKNCCIRTNISFLKSKRCYLFLYCRARGSWIFYLIRKKEKKAYDDIIKKSARMGIIDAKNRCPSVFDVAEKFNTDSWKSSRHRVQGSVVP